MFVFRIDFDKPETFLIRVLDPYALKKQAQENAQEKEAQNEEETCLRADTCLPNRQAHRQEGGEENA